MSTAKKEALTQVEELFKENAKGYVTYEKLVKFLLKNGVCKQENLQTSCENLKKYATQFDAKDSLKLINNKAVSPK